MESEPETFAPVTLGTRLRTMMAGDLTITEARSAPGVRLPWHAHEYACLVIPMAGAFNEIYHGRNVMCDRSTALFKPAGELHANEYGRSGARWVVVEFPSEQLDRFAKRSPHPGGIASFRGRHVLEQGTRMDHELERGAPFAPLMLEGLIYELVGRLLRHRHFDEASGAPRWLRATRERLHDEFSTKLTIADLALAAGVHPDHLSRCFRRHYGMLIGEYVRHLRIAWAADAIATTHLTLHAIAQEAGFVDQSEFTRRFREQLGTTPGRYRDAIRRR